MGEGNSEVFPLVEVVIQLHNTCLNILFRCFDVIDQHSVAAFDLRVNLSLHLQLRQVSLRAVGHAHWGRPLHCELGQYTCLQDILLPHV